MAVSTRVPCSIDRKLISCGRGSLRIDFFAATREMLKFRAVLRELVSFHPP